MNSVTDGLFKSPFTQRRAFSLVVVILNIVLLCCVVLSYGRYAAVYQERIYEENLGNIANLNQSSALAATTLIDSWSIKLRDIAQLVGRRGMTHDEALALIEQSNASDERQFELIGSDYTGFLARRGKDGAYIPLSYAKNAYAELQRAIDDVDDTAYSDVCFAPEFTDGNTALKYFAIYKHLPLRSENGGEEIYTLLLATESKDVLAYFNSQNGFAGQSTVLMDAAGNYIVSNSDFKSDNFFQYLYVYNDLSLDQRRRIEGAIAENGSGVLYYQNAAGQDCVFRYERMTTNDWYCVTSVPIASFRTPVMNVHYAIYAVAALLLMLLLDVSWLLAMNRRMRASMLREKEASEAKTDFLSRMSHDIRTPLNGIIGLTTLALERPLDSEMKEYLDNIKVSGEFLAGLVNDILDLSKVESGKVELKPEPYSCGDLIKYVEAVISPLCLEKGLTFQMSPPDDAPPVLLDRLRFNQIMFNLLSNAVKYTPPGGLVELYWERTDRGADGVALDFTIRDNGIGMSESFQKHMFESFMQEHAQTASTGSGLGLTIVFNLVKLMNGQLTVKSRQGVGTTFTVHLETTACKGNAVAAAEHDGADLAGRRVLLCEDNEINIVVARRLLEKWGVTVDVAVNGKIGVEMFLASAPNAYDAILMDVMMPEMNGLDATRLIRTLDRPDGASVPIIAMTANAYDTDVQNCLDAGMNAHLGKPVDHEQLRRLLSQLIGRAQG